MNILKMIFNKNETKEKLFMKELRDALLGGLAILLFFYFPYLIWGTIAISGIETTPLFITYYLILFYSLEIGIYIYLFRDILKNDLSDMLKNHKSYFKIGFKAWLVGSIVMMVSNYLIMIFVNNDISTNEQGVRELLKDSPVLFFYLAVISAPIIEELTFRLGFRKIFKTDNLFILVSGLGFGLLHIIPSLTVDTLSDIYFVIPYSALGIAFAYTYVKTKNIYTSIGLHFMHNGVLASLQILTLILGIS